MLQLQLLSSAPKSLFLKPDLIKYHLHAIIWRLCISLIIRPYFLMSLILPAAENS